MRLLSIITITIPVHSIYIPALFPPLIYILYLPLSAASYSLASIPCPLYLCPFASPWPLPFAFLLFLHFICCLRYLFPSPLSYRFLVPVPASPPDSSSLFTLTITISQLLILYIYISDFLYLSPAHKLLSQILLAKGGCVHGKASFLEQYLLINLSRGDHLLFICTRRYIFYHRMRLSLSLIANRGLATSTSSYSLYPSSSAGFISLSVCLSAAPLLPCVVRGRWRASLFYSILSFMSQPAWVR